MIYLSENILSVIMNTVSVVDASSLADIPLYEKSAVIRFLNRHLPIIKILEVYCNEHDGLSKTRVFDGANESFCFFDNEMLEKFSLVAGNVILVKAFRKPEVISMIQKFGFEENYYILKSKESVESSLKTVIFVWEFQLIGDEPVIYEDQKKNSDFFHAEEFSKQPEKNEFGISDISKVEDSAFWSLKAKISYISPVQEFRNQYGDGTVIRLQLTDKFSSINLVAFKKRCEEIVQLKLEINKVYEITNLNVRCALSSAEIGEKYSVRSKFELHAIRGTKIDLLEGENPSDYDLSNKASSFLINTPPTPERCKNLEPLSENFLNIKCNRFLHHVKIAELTSVKLGSLVNVFGIIFSIEDSTLMKRDGKDDLSMRKFTLIDCTNYSIKVCLWGKQAETFTMKIGEVIDLRLVKIVGFSYGCRSLSVLMSSFFHNLFYSEEPAVKELKDFYRENRELISKNFRNISIKQ